MGGNNAPFGCSEASPAVQPHPIYLNETCFDRPFYTPQKKGLGIRHRGVGLRRHRRQGARAGWGARAGGTAGRLARFVFRVGLKPKLKVGAGQGDAGVPLG